MSPRSWLLRVAVVVTSVLFCLMLAELGLRILEFRNRSEGGDLAAQFDRSEEASPGSGTGRFSLFGLVRASSIDEAVYELKPNLDGRFKDASLKTNAAGLKEAADYPIPKPPGVFRIVGLGDSVMFGWGVDQESSYLEVLETRLGALPGSPAVEVINCAVPGYNTTMEVALFEHRCSAYAPDLVLVHFVGNDLKRPHFMQPEPQTGSRLAALLRRAFDPEPEPTFDLLPHDLGDVDPDLRSETRGRYAWMVGEEAYREAMARLAALSVEMEAPVWILVMGEGETRSLVDAVADELGMRVIDPTARFRRYLRDHGLAGDGAHRRTFTIPGDGHPNALGHSLWADALEAAVLETLATPSSDGSAAFDGAQRSGE